MIKQARAGKAVDIDALPPPVLTGTAVKPSVSDSSQQAQTVPVKEELASTNKPAAKPPGEGNILGNVQTNPKESFFVWLIVGRFKRCYIEPTLLFYVHCFDVLWIWFYAGSLKTLHST